jgi:hypothetical protein
MKISFGYLQSTDSQKKNSGQEEKLNTVKLSGTDLEVSEVGFGGIPIIPLPIFDTANMYLTSEEKIGTALEPVRDKVVIASKTTQRDANGAADHIDTSLKQLKTDWIDIYQCHNVSNEEALPRRELTKPLPKLAMRVKFVLSGSRLTVFRRRWKRCRPDYFKPSNFLLTLLKMTLKTNSSLLHANIMSASSV